MIPVLLPLFCSFLFFAPTWACKPSQKQPQKQQEQLEKQKIQFLLQEIEQIQAVFIRNGQEHDPKNGAQTFRAQTQVCPNKILVFTSSKPVLAQDFISQIASKSSTSGKIYQIKFPDGRTLPTGDWLEEKLKEFKPPQLRCGSSERNLKTVNKL